MIILKDVPFEGRARFLHDSICGHPDSPRFRFVLAEQAFDMADGLRAHQDLLRRIYSDVTCIEGKDDKVRYLDLIATMRFMYAVFAFGTLVTEDNTSAAVIDKSVLRQKYRQGGLAKRKHHLEHHGFSIHYLSPQGERTSLSKAAQLSMSHDRHPNLVPAVKHFAESIESLPGGNGKPMYNSLSIFLKGDYEAALLRKPIPRDSLDPLRDDLVGTLDTHRDEWLNLVSALRGQCGLQCAGFWTYGGTPSWGVSFYAKGKRPLAIFTLGSDIVFVEFTLPAGSAEGIIRERRRYSDSVREKIESFHCVRCPKECGGSNMTEIDGVWVCKGRAEARRIYATLSSPEDFDSIHSMLDIIC